MKFKKGDFIKCKGEHFAEREILQVRKSKFPVRYVTRFLEDDSIVESDAKIIDAYYWSTTLPDAGGEEKK